MFFLFFPPWHPTISYTKFTGTPRDSAMATRPTPVTTFTLRPHYPCKYRQRGRGYQKYLEIVALFFSFFSFLPLNFAQIWLNTKTSQNKIIWPQKYTTIETPNLTQLEKQSDYSNLAQETNFPRNSCNLTQHENQSELNNLAPDSKHLLNPQSDSTQKPVRLR